MRWRRRHRVFLFCGFLLFRHPAGGRFDDAIYNNDDDYVDDDYNDGDDDLPLLYGTQRCSNTKGPADL